MPITTRQIELATDRSPLPRWEYANSTARLAATGFDASDVYKVAIQTDDNTLWLLVDDSPITWVEITGGGSGGGDFSSNTSVSVDGEVVLFSGTGGKTGKRATGSGIAKLTSGVLGTATAGTDYESAGAAAAAVALHVVDLDPHTQYAIESALAAIATSGSASDITAGTLSISRLADGSVTLAKIANIATARLLGRNTAGSGVIEELSASTVRTMLALGGAALLNVGTTTGTVAAGDDARFSDARTPTAHKSSHEAGGSDALTGDLDANARVAIRENSAGSVFKRRRLNFIEGSNVTITMSDDAGNEEVDITFNATGGTQTNATLATAAGTATVANTTTETSLTPSVSGSLTIAANTVVQYEVYRFVFRGFASSNGANSPTLKLYFGSTVVAQTTAVFMATCTNRAWEATIDVMVATTGASGTVWAFGTNTRFTATGSVTSCEMTGATANSTTTVDFTTSQAVTLRVTHSSAATTNTWTCTHATMTRMKS